MTAASAAIATSTTASAAPIATAPAAAATAITAAASTAARWASFARSGFVHGKRTTFHGLAVKFRDCFLRIGIGRHRNESKAARFTGELVLHERDFLHRARLGEKILQICLGRVEGKISYV
ncbi:MAG: hypothetical protein QOI04_1755 [Verrucomicrobiota bacterium]|jgi:hypothetical protein